MSRKGSAFVPHDLARPLAGAAQGPLAGLAVAVKDMYDIAGERTGGGNPQWLAAQRPASAHAEAVRRLLAAGATIDGKTVCDEFFFSVVGANAHYGTPINPRAPGRVPGGSSSGSASAVAAGAVDLALGSDTGGSVRVPAALCGIYGIRPTLGRVDLTGAMAMAPSFDTPGWFSAGPGLLRHAGKVLLQGPAEDAPFTRLRMAGDAFAAADLPVRTVIRDFLARAASLLPVPQEIVLAPDGFDRWREAFRVIQGAEIWAEYGAWIAANRPTLGPGIAERIAYASTVTPGAAAAAREVHAAARVEIRGRVTPGTLLCLPTVPSIAPRRDASPEALDAFRSRVMTLTVTAGLAGLPQVTVPAGTAEGLPCGISFIAAAGSDERLLDLAVALGPYCGG